MHKDDASHHSSVSIFLSLSSPPFSLLSSWCGNLKGVGTAAAAVVLATADTEQSEPIHPHTPSVYAPVCFHTHGVGVLLWLLLLPFSLVD